MVLVSPRFRPLARLQQASENAPALSYGETGPAVRHLQEALEDLGHPLPKSFKADDWDGIFGPETLQGLKSFQKHQGLAVDGVAGRQTLGAMERIFLQRDERYGEPVAERVELTAQAHPFGEGAAHTTARKSVRS